MTARAFPTFSIVFAVAYAIIYLLAVENNWALFTYHPALEEFGPLVQKPKDGPAMYWYGWMATSAIGALVVATVACWTPDSLTRRLWSGWSWAIPLATMFGFVYLLRGFFNK